MKIKIVTILGARPQFIKAASVSRALKNSVFEEVMVHTGQHFDDNMSEVFFREMEIPHPAYNLNINNLSHGSMTGRMLEEIEKVLLIEKPRIVMVYGDTNSTLAGALAAKKLGIAVAHVEAGLRSSNMNMPEEINRILTDRISDYLFCPSKTSVNNLKAEGFDNFHSQVYLVGDVMYDAALFYEKKADVNSDIIDKLQLVSSNYVLVTVHRQENTDNPERLRSIFGALEEINKTLPVVLPIHPRTRKILAGANINPSFDLLEPAGYFDMIQLLKHARLVMTDSGGMQKEAYFFKKFCITLRDETEWVELVEMKVNYLSGTDHNSILNTFNQQVTKKFPDIAQIYGDGGAADKIAVILGR
jgi:UDP-GlcNAc3NAcA epimerase